MFHLLTLTILGKNLSRQRFEIFLYFSQKKRPQRIICMKRQSIFSRENMKIIINLLSAEYAQRVVMVKIVFLLA